MFRRQTTGSVVCTSCGYLVGVNDDKCYHCGRRNPGLWGFATAVRNLGHDMGFVPFMTGTCIVLYGLSLVASGPDAFAGGGGLFNILSPNGRGLYMFGAAGASIVYDNHWWTLLSANWLHGSLLHIVFNLMWIRQLAPAVGEMYGPGRMVLIYTLSGIAGFAFSTASMYTGFRYPVLTIGASASIFGLLGALVYYGRRGGSSMVGSQAWSWAITNFVIGFFFPGIDNFAHAGGFVGGYLAGRFFDPLKPERIDHLVGALVCLVLSVLAVVVSVVVAFVQQ